MKAVRTVAIAGMLTGAIIAPHPGAAQPGQTQPGQTQTGQTDQARTARPEQTQQTTLDRAEVKLLERLYTASELAVRAAQVAQTQAQSAHVQQYASQLASDFEEIEQRIRAVAREHSLDIERVRGEAARAARQTIDSLRSLQGQKFDQRFLASKARPRGRARVRSRKSKTRSTRPPCKS